MYSGRLLYFHYHPLRIGLAEIITVAPLNDNAYFLISGFTISSKRLPDSADGALDAEGAQAKQEVPQRSSPLWIGELNDGRGFIYEGLMDELGIWNRALTEDEIKLTMQGIVVSVKPQSKLAITWGELRNSED